MGISRDNLGVGGLRDNVGNLAVFAKESVQGFLRKLFRGASRHRRDEFDSEEAAGIAVQVFEPRGALDEAGCHTTPDAKPWLDWLFVQTFCQFCYQMLDYSNQIRSNIHVHTLNLSWVNARIVFELDKSTAVLKARQDLGDFDW